MTHICKFFLFLLTGLITLTSLHAQERVAPTRRNVAYGEHQRLLGGSATNMDVYRPEGDKVTPVMIWIHGGGWKIGNKFGVDEKPAYFNNQGFTLISINYRLVPEVDVATQGQDVAQAIEWVKSHAAELKIDPERIFIMGHSAGAHLAALVGTNEEFLKGAGGTLADVRGIILLDGAGYDVPRQIKEAPLKSSRELYLEAFGDDASKYARVSPLEHISAGKGIPPFLILYCAQRPDAKSQSTALGKKLERAGGSVKVVGCENKTHMTINREIGIEGDAPTREISEFLDGLMKSQGE